MNARILSIAVLGLTVASHAPAQAQDTFMAWGHEFIRPGSAVTVAPPAESRPLSNFAPRAYTATERREDRVFAPASRKQRR